MAELEEPQEQGEKSEGERPEWLPENFSDPSKLAEAYKEQRRYITRLEEERKRFEEALVDLAQQMEDLKASKESSGLPEAPYNPEQDPFFDQYERALMEGDAKTLVALNLMLTEHRMQELERKLQESVQSASSSSRSEEVEAMLIEQRARELVGERFDEVADELGRLLEEKPEIGPKEDASVEEAASHLAWLAERLLGVSREGSSSQQEDESAQAKRIAQTLRSSGLTVLPTSIDELAQKRWERIQNASLGTFSELMRKQE